jgi:hypothetical protein
MPPATRMALVRAHRETLSRVLGRIPHHDPLHDCWACGDQTVLERAHILARGASGGADPGNLLLLCNECHHDQPDGACIEGQIQWLLDHETHEQRLSRVAREVVELVMSKPYAAQWSSERLLDEGALKTIVHGVRERLGRATLSGIRSSLRYELVADYDRWCRHTSGATSKKPSAKDMTAATAVARREAERLLSNHPALGERINTSLKKLRKEGKKTGGDVPYGYRLGQDGKTLQPLDSEQAVIAAARELQMQGGISMGEIGRALARRKPRMLSRTGRIFHSKQIIRMLRDTYNQNA